MFQGFLPFWWENNRCSLFMLCLSHFFNWFGKTSWQHSFHYQFLFPLYLCLSGCFFITGVQPQKNNNKKRKKYFKKFDKVQSWFSLTGVKHKSCNSGWIFPLEAGDKKTPPNIQPKNVHSEAFCHQVVSPPPSNHNSPLSLEGRRHANAKLVFPWHCLSCTSYINLPESLARELRNFQSRGLFMQYFVFGMSANH